MGTQRTARKLEGEDNNGWDEDRSFPVSVPPPLGPGSDPCRTIWATAHSQRDQLADKAS